MSKTKALSSQSLHSSEAMGKKKINYMLRQ